MKQLNDPNDLNDPNLLTFMIFYLKKFLLACGTKDSFAISGRETCVPAFLLLVDLKPLNGQFL